MLPGCQKELHRAHDETKFMRHEHGLRSAEASRPRFRLRFRGSIPCRMQPSDRDMALAAPLADLSAGWLSVRCARCGISYLPLRKLAGRYGAGTRLGELLPRLRCRTCRRRPAEIALVDDPAAGSPGGPAASW